MEDQAGTFRDSLFQPHEKKCWIEQPHHPGTP